MMPAPTAGDVAASARAFVDSIGVNVHLAYYDTPYGRFETIERDLALLDVRHVRDGVVLGQPKLCDEERDLARHGIRFTYITQPQLKPADISGWRTCAGAAIEAFEGPNEYDVSHPSTEADWVATIRTFQRSLYATVRGDAAYRNVSVIGPSFTSAEAMQRVGDLSAYLDQGNMHDYFAGREPETSGFGAGGYGGIAYNKRIAAAVSAGKPVVATETGYQSKPGQDGLDEAVQATYVTRLFLEQFSQSVPRTLLYELADEGGAPFSNYGLLRSDLTPKPAFEALRQLIRAVDGPAPPTAHRLPYVLDGAGDDVRHLLLERGDRRFVLALWSKRPSVVPKLGVPLPTPVQSVRIGLGRGYRVLRARTFDEHDRLAPVRMDASAAIDVGPGVSLVEIVPAATSRRSR